MKFVLTIEGEAASLEEFKSQVCDTIPKSIKPITKIPTPQVPEGELKTSPKLGEDRIPKHTKIMFARYLPEGKTLTQFAVEKYEEAKKIGKDIDDETDMIRNLVFSYVRKERPDIDATFLSKRIRMSVAKIKSSWLLGTITKETEIDESGNAPLVELADEKEENEEETTNEVNDLGGVIE